MLTQEDLESMKIKKVMKPEELKARAEVLDKRNKIIEKAYKHMPKDEAKETIILLNELQQLSKHINLT